MDLRDIRRVERLIEHKREQIIRMRSIAERVTGGLDVTGIRGTAEREDVRLRLVELEDEMQREVDRLIDLRLEAMRRIDALDDGDLIDIMYMRYFQHMKWTDIAKAKGRSLDWTYKAHRRAIKKYFENL